MTQAVAPSAPAAGLPLAGMPVHRPVWGWLDLDPRTKLALALTTNVAVMSVVSQTTAWAALAVCALCLVAIGAWRAATITVAIFLATVGLAMLPALSTNWVTAVVAVVALYVGRIAIVIAMGYFLFSSTTPSAFVAAMRQMRAPNLVVIPISVMFRFFPAVLQELVAVLDAMRLRNLAGSTWSVLVNPIRMTEYFIVPFIASTLAIGDDLTASAMARGLGRPGRPVSISSIRFGPGDVLGLAVIVGIVAITVASHVDLVP